MKTLELKLKKYVLIVDENDFKYYTIIDNEIIFSIEDIRLRRIKSDYESLCKGSDLTEEIASELVEYWQNMANDGFIYENYKTNLPKKKTAVESLISAIESKGFYWLENPIEKPINRDEYYKSEKVDSFEILLKKWQEAEEKTFKNPLISIKNYVQ